MGRQDLTATVDLAAVRAAAARAGLEPLGETTQAELLATLATGDVAAATLRRAGADARRTRSTSGRALARLLDPRGMGGFRVLVFGRGLPRAGTGLAWASERAPSEHARSTRTVGRAVPVGSRARDRC